LWSRLQGIAVTLEQLNAIFSVEPTFLFVRTDLDAFEYVCEYVEEEWKFCAYIDFTSSAGWIFTTNFSQSTGLFNFKDARIAFNGLMNRFKDRVCFLEEGVV
jgi:hypothetical protein